MVDRFSPSSSRSQQMPREIAEISVALATVNRPAGARRCVDALLRGNTLPREIVVIDQSDNSLQLSSSDVGSVEEVRLTYRHQHRRGLSASRNAAIELARCPIIAFTDDDCVPDRDWVRQLSLAFVERPTAAVAGSVCPLAANAPGLVAMSLRTSPRPRELARPTTAPWQLGTGANLAVRRAWLDRIGPYDERLGAGSAGRAGEDIDLLFRLLRAGAVVRYEPSAIVRHALQTRQRRMLKRGDYGWGVGGCCGIHMRRRDALGALMLARWLGFRCRRGVAAMLRGDRQTAYEEVLILAGTAGGVAYGFRTK